MFCRYAVCLVSIFRHLFYIVAVSVLGIGIELRTTVVGIDAGKLNEIERAVGAAHLMYLRTADDLGLCAVESDDLVFVV